MKLDTYDYERKAKEINNKFPSINAVVNTSQWGGRLEIEVCNISKAKILNELFPNYVVMRHL